LNDILKGVSLYKVLIVAEKGAEIRELDSGLNRMGFACSIVNNSSDFSEEIMEKDCDVLFVDIDGSPASAQSTLAQLREIRRKRHLPVLALVSTEGIGCIGSNLEVDEQKELLIGQTMQEAKI
jgi:PleD family two-component response regulator